MADAVDNLMVEHLKKIQTEQFASRDRDAQILSRLAHIETSVARLTRHGAVKLTACDSVRSPNEAAMSFAP